MEYRALGETGIEVSAIGLGTEHLLDVPREEVVAVGRTAIDRGVNYLDLIWAHPAYRDNFAAALQGRRDRAILAGHLGSALKGEQYLRTRKVEVCEHFFRDLMERLDTDYLDVAMIHNVNTDRQYEPLLRPGGVVELAHRLNREGRARAIGMSGHSVELFQRVLQDGIVDLLMLPVNMAGNAQPGRRELLQACAAQGVGVVAMKAFAGGKLLQGRKVYFGRYQTGGKAFKRRASPEITPVQCLAYALAQPAVFTVIPGVASMAELEADLAWIEASDEEKDFAAALAGFEEYVSGECVYCNHCLPCPAEIDIGLVLRLADVAGDGLTPALRAQYEALPAKAADCTACGACVKRCPFGVDVIAKIEQAAALFAA